MSAPAALAQVPPAIIAELKARYGEPQRRYHTWAHIEAMLRWASQVEARLSHPLAVVYAILFHDAVYDPTRHDNEAVSAQLLAEAEAPGLSTADRALAIAMVEATAGHRLVDDAGSDTAMFLDMDLSILGAPPPVFDTYEDNIRAEYAFVPDDAFRVGRRQVLQGFAGRERLYFSPWGQETFEVQARANLARSLARLEDAPR